MTTAGDIKRALRKRYAQEQTGTAGEQWVCLEEARSGAGFSGNNGQCDFLAINTWQSRGMELVGHEIKVTMSDWKRERDNPDKAETFARFCRRWYVAAPSELAKKIRHEVPPAWGLMSVSEAGRITEMSRPSVREPDPVPAWWWVGWLAQIDRQHKRSIPGLVEERLTPERERMRAFMEDHANRRAAAQDESTLRAIEQMRAFERATGLNLAHVNHWDLDRLGRLLRAARAGVNFDQIANQMRANLERLDEIVATLDSLPVDGEVEP